MMAKEELLEFEGVVVDVLPMPAFASSSTTTTRSSPIRPGA